MEIECDYEDDASAERFLNQIQLVCQVLACFNYPNMTEKVDLPPVTVQVFVIF